MHGGVVKEHDFDMTPDRMEVIVMIGVDVGFCFHINVDYVLGICDDDSPHMPVTIDTLDVDEGEDLRSVGVVVQEVSVDGRHLSTVEIVLLDEVVELVNFPIVDYAREMNVRVFHVDVSHVRTVVVGVLNEDEVPGHPQGVREIQGTYDDDSFVKMEVIVETSEVAVQHRLSHVIGAQEGYDDESFDKPIVVDVLGENAVVFHHVFDGVIPVGFVV